MADDRRFYEASRTGPLRSAPAALRNRGFIADVLEEWLPSGGIVLEIASGTGEHVTYFAERFPGLEWQPSDVNPDALASIAGWRDERGLTNVREPVMIDAESWAVREDWFAGGAEDRLHFTSVLSVNMDSDSCNDRKAAEKGDFDVVLNLNMVHISPWGAALGLLGGAARVLKNGGALILYGPWLQGGVETAPSNLEFDRQLRERDPQWGLRRVEDFESEAIARGFVLEHLLPMPANNRMLLFRLCDGCQSSGQAQKADRSS